MRDKKNIAGSREKGRGSLSEISEWDQYRSYADFVGVGISVEGGDLLHRQRGKCIYWGG